MCYGQCGSVADSRAISTSACQFDAQRPFRSFEASRWRGWQKEA